MTAAPVERVCVGFLVAPRPGWPGLARWALRWTRGAVGRTHRVETRRNRAGIALYEDYRGCRWTGRRQVPDGDGGWTDVR